VGQDLIVDDPPVAAQRLHGQAGTIAGAVVVLSRRSITDWTRLCIAATALLLLVRLKIEKQSLVGLSAAGLALLLEEVARGDGRRSGDMA
jgi:hypothetical protein